MLSQVLNQILTNARRAAPPRGRGLLAVFDLDSTLYDLSMRVGAIVDEFAAQSGNADVVGPEERSALQQVRITRHDWGLETPLARAGLRAPKHRELIQRLNALWRLRFFSNLYLGHDVPIEGSVEFVRTLHDAGAHILYLTGRDQPGMWDGTWASLVESGFPLDKPATDLVLKPQPGLDDAEFKADVLAEWCPRFERTVLFENEPVNINRIESRLPGQVQFVFIQTAHSGLEELRPHVERIHDFTLGPGGAREG